MEVRISSELVGNAFRVGEVVDLPADTARAFLLAGYAVEVPTEDDTGEHPPAGEQGPSPGR